MQETQHTQKTVNPYPALKMSSAKCLVCKTCQGAPTSPKIYENIVRVSNSLGPDETPSYSAFHPDPSWWNYDRDRQDMR